MVDATISSDHLEAYVDAASAFLALPIAPEYRAGVVHNLKILAAFSQLVMDAPLDEHDEPAPVFRANARA